MNKSFLIDGILKICCLLKTLLVNVECGFVIIIRNILQ